MKALTVFLALVLFSVFHAAPVHADWFQWRGPLRTGEVTDATPWPNSLSDENLTLLWEASLSEGYSAPITDGTRLFTFATRDKESEVAKAFD
ncbi:MAG: pyrrolo-quinoline quinone, partial [Verrucomicrobiota bacterium]